MATATNVGFIDDVYEIRRKYECLGIEPSNGDVVEVNNHGTELTGNMRSYVMVNGEWQSLQMMVVDDDTSASDNDVTLICKHATACINKNNTKQKSVSKKKRRTLRDELMDIVDAMDHNQFVEARTKLIALIESKKEPANK